MPDTASAPAELQPIERQKVTGCLLGLAIGDALGASVEFCPRGRFEPLTDMVGGGKFRLNPGEWTDDTSMALCLADSLINCKGFDAKDQMERYWRWGNEGYNSSKPYAFGIGKTVSKAMMAYRRSGLPYSGSKHPSTAGNGSLMRLAPIPLFYLNSLEETVNYAVLSSRTTHQAPECLAACVFFGALLHYACRGVSDRELLMQQGVEMLESTEYRGLLPSITAMEFKDKTADDICGSGYVAESLEAALWSFWHAESFADSVLAAANLGDDADTTAAICGQLSGAFHGHEAIPAGWLASLCRGADIENTAIRLLEVGIELYRWREAALE